MSSYRYSDNTGSSALLNTAVSGTNTYETQPVDIRCFQSYCFQAEWSGTPTGTITILGSLDGINFRSFGAAVSGNPAGSTSGVLIPIYGSCMKWLMLQYANASGSGQLVVSGLGKTR